jgi:hypothetical protein
VGHQGALSLSCRMCTCGFLCDTCAALHAQILPEEGRLQHLRSTAVSCSGPRVLAETGLTTTTGPDVGATAPATADVDGDDDEL